MVRIVTPDLVRIEDPARAAASVHAESATTAYIDIFPAASTPPTADDLTPAWHSMIADPDWSVLLAVAGSVDGSTDEQVVGAVAVGPDPTTPTGVVMAKLYVRPDHWGRGLGAALHDGAIETAYDPSVGMNLWVLEENRRARAFYRRRGWRLIPGPTVANDPPDVVDVLYQLGPGADAATGPRPPTGRG